MGRYGAAEYLGHQLLLHHQNQRGLVPKTVFHKLWSISDHHLSDNYGLDVSVPRYWYMYGEMVEEQSVTQDFYSAPSAPWGGQAYKPDWELEPSDFDISEEERNLIDSTVKWTLNRFERRDTPYLESYQYQLYAPNGFIRAYSELREHLQHRDLDTQEVLTQYAVRPEFDAENNRELVEAYLDEMVITFPETDDDFAELHELFLRWDDTARLILNERQDYGELEEFLDEFIDALSRGILKLKYNTGVAEEVLEQWREEADEEIAKFEAQLETRRTELLRDREMSGELEGVSEAYDETVISNLEE